VTVRLLLLPFWWPFSS